MSQNNDKVKFSYGDLIYCSKSNRVHLLLSEIENNFQDFRAFSSFTFYSSRVDLSWKFREILFESEKFLKSGEKQ